MPCMVLLLARVIATGVETADMPVREVLSRNLRDRRAVARGRSTQTRCTPSGLTPIQPVGSSARARSQDIQRFSM
jgi:hypothetical protein